MKQYYDQALKREWKTGMKREISFSCCYQRLYRLGDRFRCFIDDAWWPGTIVKREPFDVQRENSPFQCYIIRWDNGENEERLSPWDMFELDDLCKRERLHLL